MSRIFTLIILSNVRNEKAEKRTNYSCTNITTIYHVHVSTCPCPCVHDSMTPCPCPRPHVHVHTAVCPDGQVTCACVSAPSVRWSCALGRHTMSVGPWPTWCCTLAALRCIASEARSPARRRQHHKRDRARRQDEPVTHAAAARLPTIRAAIDRRVARVDDQWRQPRQLAGGVQSGAQRRAIEQHLS